MVDERNVSMKHWRNDTMQHRNTHTKTCPGAPKIPQGLVRDKTRTSTVDCLRMARPVSVVRCITAWTGRVKMECDGTSAETRFGLPAKRTNPFISAGVSVQSSTGFLGVRVGRERL